MWETLFWLALITLIYHYVGYPLVLLVLGLRRREPLRSANITPTVSLIISAYNEQEVIRQKLDNSLDLDYPSEQLEIIVASDGSTDRTPAIVREYAGAVALYHYPQRRGKNAALNETVSRAHGEILVFTDANGMYRKDAVRKLVQHFADARVGCVCGELIYRNPTGNPVAEGYNHYWRYDQWLKKLESRLHSLLGANGSIFAIRRELNEPLNPRTSNDMVLPIKIAARGYAVLYEPEAISVEAGSAGEREELRRRSRIVARGLLGVWEVLPDIIRRRTNAALRAAGLPQAHALCFSAAARRPPRVERFFRRLLLPCDPRHAAFTVRPLSRSGTHYTGRGNDCGCSRCRITFSSATWPPCWAC